MGCNTICKTCEHSNPSRVKDGMIRCVKRHIFVSPTGSCSLHSFSIIDEKLKDFIRGFGRSNEKNTTSSRHIVSRNNFCDLHISSIPDEKLKNFVHELERSEHGKQDE